jgi:hypothetical protein
MLKQLVEMMSTFKQRTNQNPRFLYLGRETFQRLKAELFSAKAELFSAAEVQHFPSIHSRIHGLEFFIVDTDEHFNVG